MTDSPEAARRAAVVVIEDQPELRDVLLTALDGKGYEVLSARNQSDALEILAARQVDLVICDPSEGSRPTDPLDRVREAFPDLSLIVVSERPGPLGLFLGPWETEGNVRTLRRPFRLTDLLAATAEALAGLSTEQAEGSDQDEEAPG